MQSVYLSLGAVMDQLTVLLEKTKSDVVSCRFFSLNCMFVDQELIPYGYSSSCSCWGNALQKASGSDVSNRIGMKFGRIFEVNTVCID